MNRSSSLLCISFLLSFFMLNMVIETSQASPVPVSFDKNTVQFIFTTLSDTDTTFRPGGTCFTVEILTKHRPSAFMWTLYNFPWINMLGLGKPDILSHARYFVTAKHVLYDENGNLRPRLFLRVDNQSGGVSYLSINASIKDGSYEVLTSSDKSVDMAVIRPAISTPEARSKPHRFGKKLLPTSPAKN